MSREEVIQKVGALCADVFEDEELVVTEQTVAADVEGWDSLTHLQLMSDIEKEFHIRFTLGEIQKFANVGQLVDTILKHLDR